MALVILFGFLIIFGLSLVLAFPFMWMWNFAVVQAITVTQPIDYWVAFCLMMFIGLFIAGNNKKS